MLGVVTELLLPRRKMCRAYCFALFEIALGYAQIRMIDVAINSSSAK